MQVKKTATKTTSKQQFFHIQVPIPNGYKLCKEDTPDAKRVEHPVLGVSGSRVFYLTCTRPRALIGGTFYVVDKEGTQIKSYAEEYGASPLRDFHTRMDLAEAFYQEGNYFLSKVEAAKELLKLLREEEE